MGGPILQRNTGCSAQNFRFGNVGAFDALASDESAQTRVNNYVWLRCGGEPSVPVSVWLTAG